MRISDWSSDVCSSDLHKYSVLDARRREHALVAFVGALRSGLEPFLDDDRHKGQRKHPAGHQHGPDAVVDDPGHEGEVVLQVVGRSEEHTSELQSLMRISYAVLCMKKKKTKIQLITTHN